MRSMAESGFDPYAVFSRECYEKVKENEPEFDRIMEKVWEVYWKDHWSKEEYLRRIKQKDDSPE